MKGSKTPISTKKKKVKRGKTGATGMAATGAALELQLDQHQ